MNKASKLIYLAVVCAILLAALPALAAVHQYTDEEVAAMVKNAPSAGQYPQAGGITLLSQKVITYNSDYSAVVDEHLVAKVFQDRAKDPYGDLKRRYDKNTDSMVVIKAVTYLADGTILPVESKAINNITPSDLANASIYSNLMQKVISFPGMAPGVCVELKLRTFSKAPATENERFVWGGDLFQTTDPIVHKELSVIVPSGVEIKYTYQNEGLDYNTTTENGMITHTWQINNSSQIIAEDNMPKLIKIAPRLIYTNMSDWGQLSKWFAAKFYPHVKTDGAIATKAAELVKGAVDVDAKVRQIALYVIKDIRGVGQYSLYLGSAGYEPHDADAVLANKYGDWRDKVVLLVSLLKAAGIESYPELVHLDAPPLAQDYPSLRQFNALYVYVPKYQNKPLWINCFADNAYFGYVPAGQGGTGLLVKPDTWELLPISETPAEENLALNRFELSVKPNGDVDGNLICSVSGAFDISAREQLKDATPVESDQYFQQSANAIGEGGRNISYEKTNLSDLSAPAKVLQKFTVPEVGVVQGNMMILSVPPSPFSFAQMPIAASQTQRTYDFVFEPDMMVKNEGIISLPKGYKAVYVAEPVKIQNQFGAWEARFELSPDSTSVKYFSTVSLTDNKITTEEYPEFKKACDSFAVPKNTMILLEKK
jgi:hypothetical protein